MTAPEFDLAQLLRPVDPELFFSRYWEREPLLINRADPGFYRPLVTLQAIEAFISRGDARYPAIRLAKGGKFLAADTYAQDFRYGDEVFRGIPDLEVILSEYNQGATLTLPAWHRACPPLARLCARLEAALDHAVNTNVYLTPAGAAGFTPHYDNHEVLVLQIAGRKHWRVYPPPMQLPHRTQPFDFDSYVPPEQALLECELAAGDLLYLPRGHVHTTTTAGEPSAHVTIGITVYTWVELLSEACQSAVQLPQFRTALPPGFAQRADVRSALAARLPQLLRQLADGLDAEAAVARFAQRIQRTRARPPLEFRAEAGIGPLTALRTADGVDWSLSRGPEGLILLLNGRRIRLQAAVEPLLNAMRTGGNFTPQTLPPVIELGARLSLVRYLAGMGLLQTV